MPRPNAVNPLTGKRRDFVDPAHKNPEVVALERNIAILERQGAAIKARDDLLAYTQFTMPDPSAPNDPKRSAYRAKKFHRAVAKALMDVEAGKTVQLIFCMPPRHGKTELATQRMAAWVSGRHPEWNIAVATYADTLADDFGANTRTILTSPQHKQVFPKYKLRRGGAAKNNIQTDRGGRLVFVGRGSALTGRGMHIGLGDDLFKDHEEARSPTIRDQAWNWFTKVFMTRRMGLKLVILTMTRWHSDDVIGRLTDPENPHYNEIEAKRWKIIRLPAIAEDDDPLGREPGEALWPEEYGIDFLESQKRIDPIGFSALYQQRPSAVEGSLFLRESIQHYSPGDLPAELRVYAGSDHAFGEKQRNDYSVFLIGGIDKQDNLWLLDCYWNRVRTDIAIDIMIDMAATHKPILWWAGKDHITGSVKPFLYKRMEERQTYFNLREMPTKSDKVSNAQPIAARVAMGKVYFPKNAAWSHRAIEQLVSFPGTHDDFVDALAQFGQGLRSQFKPGGAPTKKGEPAFGSLAWLRRNDKWSAEQKARAAAGGF